MGKDTHCSAVVIPGDCFASLRTLPDASVHCCVTSPPYWGLRDYGHAGQIGLEETPEAYVARMVEVFREVRRVLRDDGTCWINLGDAYCSQGGERKYGSSDGGTGRGNAPGARLKSVSGFGDGTWDWIESNQTDDWATDDWLKELKQRRATRLKPKDLIGMPWRTAFALQADGWWLRQDIIWAKPNPMPESVRDRCTKAHEYIFLLTKSDRYYYDAAGGKEACNRRSVWTITTKPYRGAHFAVMPPDLVEPCVKAGCPERGTVLDPFAGSGTTLAVALALGRNAIGCELNPEYVTLAEERIAQTKSRHPLFVA